MRLPTIVELARGHAEFVRYQDGSLWYRVGWEERFSPEGSEVVGTKIHWFDFPIPVSDDPGGVFLPEDKAIAFMRWIRRHLEYLRGALAEGVYDQ